MEMRVLGRTGMRVSTQCLGTMMFGAWGNTDEAECVRIIHAALDAGINFVDTADVYGSGGSEEIVGKALRKGRRDNVILATKFTGSMGPDISQRGASRRWIMRAVEDSLRRLNTDWIDLYQVHRIDHSVDLDDTMSALTDLVRAGKVRAIGSSTFPAESIVEAQWVAESRGRERLRCEQPPYSILVRGVENAVLPACARHGMGVIAWSPLAGGWLTGKYRKGQPIPEGSRAQAPRIRERFDLALPENQRKQDIVEELIPVAADAGMSMTHMALAFVLNHPAVTSAIIGPRTMDQLEEILAGADQQLDAGTLDRIDAINPPGNDVNRADSGYQNPHLAPAARRR